MATVSQVSQPIEAVGAISDFLTTVISSGNVAAIGGAISVRLSVGHIYFLGRKSEHAEHGVNGLQKLEFAYPLLLVHLADHPPPIDTRETEWASRYSDKGGEVSNPVVHQFLKEFPYLVSPGHVCRPTRIPSETRHSIDTGDSAPSTDGIKGNDNGVVDCLSRPVSRKNVKMNPTNLLSLAKAQESEKKVVADSEIEYLNDSSHFREIELDKEIKLKCETLAQAWCPYVPKDLRGEFHSISHMVRRLLSESSNRVIFDLEWINR
ncbi:unnamed protein product [Lepeophtheirus salmonis]|uniref:(salmon louse) hypothetical protein n=1 Tax=Lepeophtheirus salmonis TaxID=72036 RepID=A0A7R8CB53_LEPSM|nr:unnamed protein product [Lepeophtheirus salmonis]CAF2757474.1 unnamed protein product [Lepeophtheirus salmonis]